MSNEDSNCHIRQKQKVKEVTEAMKTIVDATNTMGSDKLVTEGIVEGLTSCHRTLQQSFMRCFVAAMKEYGDTPFRDARNDASVDFARKIAEMEEHFPFI